MKNRKLLTTALVLALSVSSMGMTVKAANEDAVASNYLEANASVLLPSSRNRR